jgi:hypothetical protein
MKRFTWTSIVLAIVGTGVGITAADAGGAKKQPASPPAAVAATAEHPKSATYRRAPEVRGFIQRRGGYSYGASDSLFSYGDGRTTLGANGRFFGRQTNSGPFDNGFFFDSGIGPRGGDSPYRN